MKICQNCKSQVDDNYNYCLKCLSTNIEYVNSEDNNLELNNTNVETKKCKYCKSQIDKDATVCPNCRRGQNIYNRKVSSLWLIPIGIIIVIGLYFYLSPNAPLKVRDFVCSSGLRSDRRYCSYFIWETYDNR